MTATFPQLKIRNEILAVLGLFILVNILCSLYQKPTNINDGRGSDGSYYCKLAENRINHIKELGLNPQAYCVAGPFLASIVDTQDVSRGFFLINFTSNILLVVLFALWMRHFIQDWKIRFLLYALFMGSWCGPIRLLWYYHTLQDFWPIVFILASFLLMAKSKDLWITSLLLSLLGFVGVFFREIVVVAPVAFLFVDFRWNSPFRSFFGKLWLKLLPLLSTIGGWAIIKSTVAIDPASPWTYLDTIHDLALHPYWGRFIVSWFDGLGPLLVIFILRPWTTLRFLLDRFYILVALAAFAFILLTSSAEERFYMWLSPLVYLLAGVVLEKGGSIFKSWIWAGLLLVCQAVSQRFFWATPDQLPSGFNPGLNVWLTPLGDKVGYLDLLSYYETPDVITHKLTQYLWVCAFFIGVQLAYDLWLKPRQPVTVPSVPATPTPAKLARKKPTKPRRQTKRRK